MGRLIVTAFTTLDGVVEDPDGSDGTPFGGWAMRHGPQAVAGASSVWVRSSSTARCCSGVGPGITSGPCGPAAATRSPRR